MQHVHMDSYFVYSSHVINTAGKLQNIYFRAINNAIIQFII